MPETDRVQDVAAILVNWNGFEDSIAALESLRSASPTPGFVVVVDNGSTDGSAERIASWARARGLACTVLDRADQPEERNCNHVRPWPCGLTLVMNPRNSGFGAGVNLGARVAIARYRPRYLLLLNNDATVAPDFLTPLLAELADPLVAAATGLIYYMDRPGKLWYAGGRLDRLRALGAHRTGPPPREPQDVEFVTGCFAAVKADLLEKIGLLPEEYFLYSEDVEMCFLLRRAGYRLRFTPHAVAYHKVNAAAGHWRESRLVAYLHHRNRFWFARRNLRGLERALAIAWLLPTRVGRALAELARGRPRIARQIVRGTWDGLLGDIR
jgi:GT2 family glycosyltransferase